MEETLNLPNENPANPSDFDCVGVADAEPENASLLLGSMDYTEIVGTYEMRKEMFAAWGAVCGRSRQPS